jgi:hypothetical protein
MKNTELLGEYRAYCEGCKNIIGKNTKLLELENEILQKLNYADTVAPVMDELQKYIKKIMGCIYEKRNHKR